MSNQMKRVKIAREETAYWLAKSGRISAPGAIEVDRALSDYGINSTELWDLSTHIAQAFRTKAGIEIELTHALREELRRGTVGNFITAFSALPGRPTTGMGGPTKPKARSGF